jgi:hypothetical protein
MDKKLHENCSDDQRNIISYHYNIDNDSMSFSGKICVNDL